MSLTRRWLGGFTVAVALFPGDVRAQTVARSFEELQAILKVGQTVVITDDGGRQTKGRLTDLSPSVLVVSTPNTRTFAEGTVAEIRSPDSLSNGVLIGAAIGAGFATWDYLIDPSEPGNAAIFAVAIGLGTAIGAGIDALHKGGKVLYVSPQLMPGLELSSFRGNQPEGALFIIAGNFGWCPRCNDSNRQSARGVAGGAFLNRRTSIWVEANWFTPTTVAVTSTSSCEITDGGRTSCTPLTVATSGTPGNQEIVQWSYQTRMPYSFSGFLGYHPPNWHRLHWGLLGGITVKPYDHTFREESTGFGQIVGERHGTRAAMAFGIDLRIVLSPHLAVAPQVRVDLSPLWSGLRAGTGLQWTF
jgi:hypothetical protein